jgi:HIRAN domain
MLNRSDFLKKLFTSVGVATIPNVVLAMAKQYQRIYLMQDFVRGFKYYEGPKLLKELEAGAILQLVREPKNNYDEFAIALHYNSKKVGFVPMESNEMLAKILDAGLLQLHAEIQAVQPNAKTWENLAFTIYALRESNEPLPEDAQYLLQVVNPEYITASSKDYYVEVDIDWEN